MVYHLKPCRDKLDFCPDEFFTDTYQGTATLFAYHLAFVDDMKDLLVLEILLERHVVSASNGMTFPFNMACFSGPTEHC